MFLEGSDKLLSSLDETDGDFHNRILDSPPVNITTCSAVGYTGYRWATQIDPYWNIYFLGKVLTMADAIEKSRLPSDVVYSYRYSPNYEKGSLFDQDISWRGFQSDSLDYVNDNKNITFVVTCDIADFYTRIYHHRLENALDRLDPNKTTSSVIKKMIQNFSGTNSYGLPVGGAAARILAELSIDSVDQNLTIQGIKYKRYVDDFTIFCNSKEAAHIALTYISRLLMETEGLTLQKHKTSILSKEEFISLTNAKLNGSEDSEGSTTRARFMSLPIRYDPYSQNADAQYEQVKESLQDFDLLGLLGEELQKSKINQSFSKQLIRSFAATEDNILSDAFRVISNSINELYPIFTTIMQVAITNWMRFDDDAKNCITLQLRDLISKNSFIMKTELNLAYTVRLVAKNKTTQNEQLLVSIYNTNPNSILIRSLVTQAMAKWGVHYWLSGLKRSFQSMDVWQRRQYIIASYLLGDEGAHWRLHTKKNFNFIENIYVDWAAARKNLRTLQDAL
jgi:hypothetical protein